MKDFGPQGEARHAGAVSGPDAHRADFAELRFAGCSRSQGEIAAMERNRAIGGACFSLPATL